MTSDEFRQDAERVRELRAILANPILQEALLVIHDSTLVQDAPDSSESLASVRKLSRLSGRAKAISELHDLATSLSEPKPLPEPDFGVSEKPPEGWNPSQI